ncbi:MAG: amidohydrolase family protein [Betaproteobacteria bacterium]|nr:amidohydrolase family protein [Betaproteobacteria bacterium]
MLLSYGAMQTLERNHRRPSRPLPSGAADCHMHVFGPFSRFPLAAERAYNVNEAPLAAHERMKARVGLERTVLVQPSGHGTDNRAMLEALAALGKRGRGVAVVAHDAPLHELEALHAAGVRAVRLNLYTLVGRYKEDPQALLDAYARLVAALGWHLQLFCSPATLVSLEAAIARTAVPVVIDHMGYPDAALGLGQPVFQAVLRLAASGAWVKVAGADRVTQNSGRLRDAVPFIRALVEAAPSRIVWGSDWPNIGFHPRKQVRDAHVLAHRELDAGELLDVLIEAVPDPVLLKDVLADNPARLYGFEAP